MKFLKTFVVAILCVFVLGNAVASAAMPCCWNDLTSNSKELAKEMKDMPCHKADDSKLQKHSGCECQTATQAQLMPLPEMQREAAIEQIARIILPEPMRSLEVQTFYQPPKQNS